MSEPATQHHAIEVSGVTVKYGTPGQTDILALENVSITVRAGDFTGIIGPNGGGKSTLLKVILGLVRPDAGSVRLFGVELGGARLGGASLPRELTGLVGFVPQKPVFDRNFPLTVRDAVVMGRYGRLGLLRRPGAQDYKLADENIDLLGMGKHSGTPIGNLSGGEQQRVFIARALCADPKLLVLDEPAAGIDAPSTDSFHSLLDRLNRERGLTIVMTSHDIGMVVSRMGNVICLNRKVHCHGMPQEVLSSHELQNAYGCEVELLVHGAMPHRVVPDHTHGHNHDHGHGRHEHGREKK